MFTYSDCANSYILSIILKTSWYPVPCDANNPQMKWGLISGLHGTNKNVYIYEGTFKTYSALTLVHNIAPLIF
jgi:hypothetical protein